MPVNPVAENVFGTIGARFLAAFVAALTLSLGTILWSAPDSAAYYEVCLTSVLGVSSSYPRLGRATERSRRSGCLLVSCAFHILVLRIHLMICVCRLMWALAAFFLGVYNIADFVNIPVCPFVGDTSTRDLCLVQLIVQPQLFGTLAATCWVQVSHTFALWVGS